MINNGLLIENISLIDNFEKFLIIDIESFIIFLANKNEIMSMMQQYELCSINEKYFTLCEEDKLAVVFGEKEVITPYIAKEFIVVPFNNKLKWKLLKDIIKKEKFTLYNQFKNNLFKMITIKSFYGLTELNKLDIISIDGEIEELI